MKTRYSALTTLIILLAIICSCKTSSVGSSGKDSKKNTKEDEVASFIEADSKSHISLKNNGGVLVNRYYIPNMREDRGFLEVKSSCDIYYDRDDGLDCLHTITSLNEKDGVYQKKWTISDIEGDMVIIEEAIDYIYFFTQGCCGGPNSIKIYNTDGTYINEAWGDISVTELQKIWRVSENNNNYERDVLLGVNDDELFMIDRHTDIIYKSALPDDILLLFPYVKFADNDTISLYTFNHDECEVEAFFKINKEKKALTHKETKVVSCSKTDSE